MKNIYLLTLFLANVATADGQFGSYHYYHQARTKGEKKFEQRTYIGISMPVMKMNMLSQYQDPASGNISSSLFSVGSGGLGLSKAWGFMGGSCAKLVTIDETSMIALDIAAAAEIYNYHIGYAAFDSNNYKLTYTYTSGDANQDLFCLVMRMPISVMYKIGNEVSCAMSNQPMFSAGAGLAPSFIESSYANESGVGFKLAPFVTAELGMWFAKLRACYYFGNYTYIQATGDYMYTFNAPGDMLATASSRGSFVLSLLFLPYAAKWGGDNY